MDNKKKNECNNQWATSNISWSSKAEVNKKDERNNQWASTLKKSPDMCPKDNYEK